MGLWPFCGFDAEWCYGFDTTLLYIYTESNSSLEWEKWFALFIMVEKIGIPLHCNVAVQKVLPWKFMLSLLFSSKHQEIRPFRQ